MTILPECLDYLTSLDAPGKIERIEQATEIACFSPY